MISNKDVHLKLLRSRLSNDTIDRTLYDLMYERKPGSIPPMTAETMSCFLLRSKIVTNFRTFCEYVNTHDNKNVEDEKIKQILRFKIAGNLVTLLDFSEPIDLITDQSSVAFIPNQGFDILTPKEFVELKLLLSCDVVSMLSRLFEELNEIKNAHKAHTRLQQPKLL